MDEYDFVTIFEQTKRTLSEREKLLRLGAAKLNFGCGEFPLPGWTNIDGGDGEWWHAPDNENIVQLDIAAALAFIDDASVRYISSEQFFEHFPRLNGYEICKQWFRILKPGGVLRLQVPDLYHMCKMYLNEVPFADWETVQKPRRLLQVQDAGNNATNGYDLNRVLLEKEDLLPCHVVNRGFYCDGHRYVYDFAYFEQMLGLVGFREVARCQFGESDHEALRGIDKHDGGETGKGWIPKIALCVEAIK